MRLHKSHLAKLFRESEEGGLLVDTPEKRLILAIVTLAIRDATLPRPTKDMTPDRIRADARAWLADRQTMISLLEWITTQPEGFLERIERLIAQVDAGEKKGRAVRFTKHFMPEPQTRKRKLS